jgi:3-oxoacyl-[acyl-carrier protein] reductase
MINFEGKTALITGASGSIGQSCSKLLHDLGANLVISGTRQDKLQELAQSLGDKRVRVHRCDLNDYDALEDLINKIDELDILVCNAGITDDALSIRMSIESFEKVLRVNLTASFALNKAAIKKMMKRRYGRIVNVSSVVGFSGNPGQANYCASKAGLVSMSKAIAGEFAERGITVNCVAPGFIESNMTNKLTPDQKDAIFKKIPAKKFGMPSDVANAIAFLASDAAAYINGSTIHVNGGMLML